MPVNPADRRKPATVTIPESLLEQAKSLNLNISQAAEAGIAKAVKTRLEQQWLEENRGAIEAYNRRIEEHGTALTPLWLREDKE